MEGRSRRGTVVVDTREANDVGLALYGAATAGTGRSPCRGCAGRPSTVGCGSDKMAEIPGGVLESGPPIQRCMLSSRVVSRTSDHGTARAGLGRPGITTRYASRACAVRLLQTR